MKKLLLFTVLFSMPYSALQAMEEGVPTTAIEYDFFKMVRNGDVEKVRRELQRDSTLVNAHDRFGTTPLHFAVITSHPQMVALLIEHGADINYPDKDEWVPLHFAAASPDLESAKILLRNGANRHIKNLSGKTPLDIAKEYGKYSEIYQTLSAKPI